MHGVVVGREREIAEASGFLDEAADRPCALLLVGEAGIGKTTVWHAVVADATGRGRTVIQARPSEAEAELAFAGLTDLFARVDDVALGSLPDAQRAALDQALRRSEADATAGLVRSLSVAPPPTPDGKLRIIDIDGVDRQACGGTHLSNTAQSAPFRITKVENKGKRNRRIRFELYRPT